MSYNFLTSIEEVWKGKKVNIASILEKVAFYFPDHIAVIDKDKSIRFNQFNRDASRVASALHGRGIRPGDHVALCAPNSYAWLAFYFGVLRAGAVAVTFSHLLMKNELTKILLDCNPKVLFTADQKLADLSEIQKQVQPGLIISENGDISYDRLAATDIGRTRPLSCTRGGPPAFPKVPC